MSRPPESGSGEPVPAPMHCCLRCGWEPIEGMLTYREIHGDEAKCIRCRESLVGQVDPYPASPGGEPPTPRATQEALEALDRLYAELIDLGGTPMSSRTPELDYQTVRAALGSARPPLPPQEISPDFDGARAALASIGLTTARFDEERGRVYDVLRSADAALESVSRELEGLNRMVDSGLARESRLREELDGLRRGHQSLMDQTVRIRRAAGVSEGAEGDTEDFVRALRGELDALRKQSGEPSREPTLEEAVRNQDDWLCGVMEPRAATLENIVQETADDLGKRWNFPIPTADLTALTERVRARLSSPEAPR